MVWIGWVLKDDAFPIQIPVRKGYFPLDQVLSNLTLNTSRRGVSTTSLLAPVPVPYHPPSEEFSLVSNPDFFQF